MMNKILSIFNLSEKWGYLHGDDESYSLSKSIDGGFYIAGYSTSFDGDVTGNHGGYDYWIVKLDSSGNIEWEKSFGGSASDHAFSICTTTDSGCIVTGRSSSSDGDVDSNYGAGDYLVIKLTASGEVEFIKNYGGSSDDYALSISQSENGYVVGGGSNSNDFNVSGNNGGGDSWVFEINFDGEIIWQNALGGSDDESARSVDITNDNGFIVANQTVSNDGDVSGNHGSFDYWITKLNEDGILQWQKCLGGSEADDIYSIKATLDGGILCAAGEAFSTDGDVSGHHGVSYNTDAWLIKLDSLGNLEWQKCLGGSKGDGAYCVNETSDNGFIVAGATVSNDDDVSGHHEGVEINTDYWIVKLDSTGSIEWQKCLGGFDHDRAYSVEETNDGGYIITGLTNSTDGDVTGNHGSYDYWVVKLAPPCPKDTFYADMDGDGFGDISNDSLACELPPGFVTDSSDCNDTNSFIHPFVFDLCNAIDDDCDGNIDEDAISLTWYLDADNDGFGNISFDSITCFELTGYVFDSTDCNDSNSDVNPGMNEICNQVDDNCNELIDDDLTFTWYYLDADGDNFGNAEIDTLWCASIIGFVTDSTDCDDTNPDIYPGAPEILNGLDDDCDLLIDENLAISEALLQSIKIYPNPTENTLHIEYSGNEKISIELVNITGQILFADKIISSSKKINVSGFPSGIYVLRIYAVEEEAAMTFVKE